MTPVDTPNRNLASGHAMLQQRWAVLELKLAGEGFQVTVLEVFRSNLRQQYLFGAGRTAEQLVDVGVSAMFARPDAAIVTDAWSSKVSAHGWVEEGAPASCAIDAAPLNPDGTIDWANATGIWDRFVAATQDLAPTCGLRHFRNAQGCISDRPHLQLVEWSDASHSLLVLPPTPPMAA